MPTVSVLIPFHNRVQWTAEAVQSVLDQTYSDFEIILLDDGSTEDVAPLLQLADERVRYIRQENNKGSAAARNRGLDLARGRYIAFLDSDDLFLPDKLEKQVALMDQRPDVVISHTSYQRISRTGERLEVLQSSKFSGKVYPLFYVYVDPHIATPTVMIRHDALDETVRFRESLRIGEDVLFWLHFVKRSDLLSIDEPLTQVRVHGENASMDPGALAEGTTNLIRYGLLEDKDLSFTLRRRLLSKLYLMLASIYLAKSDRVNYWRFVFYALIAWPFHDQARKPFREFIYGHLRNNRNRLRRLLKKLSQSG